MCITDCRSYVWRISFLPNHTCYILFSAEYFIAKDFQIIPLVIINANPKAAVLRQKPPQNLQSRADQLQPLAMLQVVIVVLKRGTGIIGRIYVPADFDTIEKAFSRAKTTEKGIK